VIEGIEAVKQHWLGEEAIISDMAGGRRAHGGEHS
jgi:hypothetical protein